MSELAAWFWLYIGVLILWWLVCGCIIALLTITPEIDVKREARWFLAGPLWPIVLPIALALGVVWLWRQAFPKEKP